MSNESRNGSGWEQKTQSISMLMVLVLVILLVQLWLLTSAMDEFLAARAGMALPTFFASGGCFLVNLWLVRYVAEIDRNRK